MCRIPANPTFEFQCSPKQQDLGEGHIEKFNRQTNAVEMSLHAMLQMYSAIHALVAIGFSYSLTFAATVAEFKRCTCVH